MGRSGQVIGNKFIFYFYALIESRNDFWYIWHCSYENLNNVLTMLYHTDLVIIKIIEKPIANKANFCKDRLLVCSEASSANRSIRFSWFFGIHPVNVRIGDLVVWIYWPLWSSTTSMWGTCAYVNYLVQSHSPGTLVHHVESYVDKTANTLCHEE